MSGGTIVDASHDDQGMMSEPSDKDQQKSNGGGASRDTLTRREDAWEDVLVRAAQIEDADGMPARGNSPDRAANQRRWQWLKAALPIILVLIYVGIKTSGGWRHRSNSWPGTIRQPDTLSGIRPAEEEVPALDRATRALVGELEALMKVSNFRGVKNRVSSADAPLKANPIVHAFDLIARTRLGERNLDIEKQIIALESRLGSAQGDYPGLVREVGIAHADQILKRSADGETLARNTDTILQLLGPTPDSPYAVEVRLRAARQFEQVGVRTMESGKGIIRTDSLKVREARAYFQTALHFIVSESGWLKLTPVTPRASPDVERIVQRIREANKVINGIALPFSDSDSTTWTGKKGDPVHDQPAGTP